MNTIEDFIKQASQSIGVSEANTGVATSGLLNMIKDEVPGSDGTDFLAKIPGATALLSLASGGKATGGGGLGGLMNAASGLLGGKAGSAVSLLSLFKDADMNSDQAGSFVSMFFDFAKSKVGGELAGRVLGQIPELQKVLG